MKEIAKISTHIGKDSRVRVYFVYSDGTRTVQSYPRYLMEQYLGRPLEPYEDVHHIDGNTLNNDISNLEIKLHGEHQREHSTKYHDVIVTCDWCHKEFLWTAKQ